MNCADRCLLVQPWLPWTTGATKDGLLLPAQHRVLRAQRAARWWRLMTHLPLRKLSMPLFLRRFVWMSLTDLHAFD